MNFRPLRNKENVKLCNWNDYSEDKDVYIYKIIPYKYLLKWLQDNNMRLDQVSAWDDVYELFLFKQDYLKDGKNVDFISAAKAIYGQSWSLQNNSDALWRIYSQDKLSVKIKVSVKKIIELLDISNTSIQQSACIYLGKVEYLNEKNIISKIKKEYVPELFNEETIVNSLFVKRDNFKYENEIRIILWKEYNEVCSIKDKIKTECFPSEECLPAVQPYLNINISPAEIIEEVEIDFRLDDNLSRAFTCSLQNLLPNAIVKKSSLGTIKKNTYNL